MNTVILLLTNDGFQEYTYNFLKSLLFHEISLSNVILYCLDSTSYNHYTKKFPNLCVKKTPCQFDLYAKYTTFAKNDFNKLCLEKLKCVSQELQRDNIVLYFDLDIYITSGNIIKRAQELFDRNNVDMLIQLDIGLYSKTKTRYCAGMFFVKPTDNTKYLFGHDSIFNYEQDQKYLNQNIHHVKYTYLPPHEFPSGAFWFQSSFKPYNLKAVHYNFIVGSKKKERMKQYKHWINDDYFFSQYVKDEKTCLITYNHDIGNMDYQYNADIFITPPDFQTMKRYSQVILVNKPIQSIRPTLIINDIASVDQQFVIIPHTKLLHSLSLSQLNIKYNISTINCNLYTCNKESERKTILIYCKSGLGNKLRLLYTAIERYKNELCSIIFTWDITKECNGSFDEVFEVKDSEKHWIMICQTHELPKYLSTIVNQLNNYKKFHFHTINGIHCIDTYYAFQETITSYSVNCITYNSDVMNRVNKLQKLIGKQYIAIHVRRTDLKKDKPNQLESEDEYYKWIDNYTCPVFVATDNVETQKIMKNNMSNKVFINDGLTQTNTLRKSSLLNCVVDFKMCVDAFDFFGTSVSTFTKTIHIHRNLEYSSQ